MNLLKIFHLLKNTREKSEQKKEDPISEKVPEVIPETTADNAPVPEPASNPAHDPQDYSIPRALLVKHRFSDFSMKEAGDMTLFESFHVPWQLVKSWGQEECAKFIETLEEIKPSEIPDYLGKNDDVLHYLLVDQVMPLWKQLEKKFPLMDSATKDRCAKKALPSICSYLDSKDVDFSLIHCRIMEYFQDQLCTYMKPGPESKNMEETDAEEIIHLQQIADSFFEGRENILMQPSGDQRRDRLTAVCRIYAYLKASNQINARTFPGPDTKATQNHIKCLSYWEDVDCYDGGNMCPISEEFYFTIDIIEDSEWNTVVAKSLSRLGDNYTDKDNEFRERWEYTGQIQGDDALVYQPHPRSIYMQRPFGIDVNLCFKFNWN